jgi:hypothetical protein
VAEAAVFAGFVLMEESLRCPKLRPERDEFSAVSHKRRRVLIARERRFGAAWTVRSSKLRNRNVAPAVVTLIAPSRKLAEIAKAKPAGSALTVE